MILHYTKHAEEKFFILQKHGKQILKEDINEIIKFPEKVEEKKNYNKACGSLEGTKDRWEVVYKKEETVYRILTFYPIV